MSRTGLLDEKNMESNERTPLIATVLVDPPRRRYQHNVVRRFCTLCLFSALVIVTTIFLLQVALAPDGYSHRPNPVPDHTSAITFQELQEILLGTPEAANAREWSRYYTSGPHLAGKNYSQAEWTQNKFQEFGIKSHIVAYDTYINYPLGHRLALYEKADSEVVDGTSDLDAWKVKFEASLEEDVLEEDQTSGLVDRVPTFHGYSATGNVTAPYVYVNYGTYQDYEDLIKANISLEGKIAVAKYGGIFRGLKVKRAQDLGMVGAILFTDPGDDGDSTEENGVAVYPDGPARNPTSVQRGSTQFLSFAPGDP